MNLIKVNDSNFDNEVLKNEIPVLAVFSAEWCGPCHQFEKVLKSLSSNKIKICHIDVDISPEKTELYMIRSVPTTLLFNKAKLLTMHSGFMKVEDLKRFLEINEIKL